MSITTRKIKELSTKYSSLLLPGMSPATLMLAFEVQKHIPVRTYQFRYQFADVWMEYGLPIAEPLLEQAAKSCMVDKPMALELARRLYAYRSNYFTKPNYVLGQCIPFLSVAADIEDLNEQDESTAWYFLMDSLSKHSEIFEGLTVFGRTRPIAGARKSIVGEIFDNLEDELEGKVPTHRINAMRQVIDLGIRRLLEFMTTSRDGLEIGAGANRDFVIAALEVMGIADIGRDHAMQILLDKPEAEGWTNKPTGDETL